jgi:hypothetical protein
MRQTKDVYYLKTRTLRWRFGQAPTSEHDYVAIRLELVRLWLLFIPTMFAVGFLVISSARGKFAAASFLNRLAGTSILYPASLSLAQLLAYLSIVVAMILFFWVSERRALRNVEACSAAHHARRGWTAISFATRRAHTAVVIAFTSVWCGRRNWRRLFFTKRPGRSAVELRWGFCFISRW